MIARAAMMCIVISVALLATSCEVSDDSKDTVGQRPAKVTADQVIVQFSSVAGVPLELQHGRLRGGGGLSAVESVAPAPRSAVEAADIKARYGKFAISVFEALDQTTRQALVGEETPDSSGIYWEEQYEEDGTHQWYARKYYGNLQLQWWNDEQKADERWRELDALMTDLLRKRGGTIR